MYVAHLSLHDFRSYGDAEVTLAPGATSFIGRNGQGKTNLVEAIDYLSRLGSHRVATDSPLVRAGAERAVVRAAVVRGGRQAVLEVEINPGASNRARVNSSPLPRARELLGTVRTVLFSPDDLSLVKGDPSHRRRFLDDLLVQRAPRFAGVRADYERVLRQRNSLLKTARRSSAAPATLDVWDAHLAQAGAELLAARIALAHRLQPVVARAYDTVAGTSSQGTGPAGGEIDDTRAAIAYQPSLPLPDHDAADPDREVLAQTLVSAMRERRNEELVRGVSLVGPHRDDLRLALGAMPAKGYASHGESWSMALALRLACYQLLQAEGDDPILILDDVFAELDTDRREQLAELVAGSEQVLVTGAVPEDVPAALAGVRVDVVDGKVLPRAD
ncbi:MAG TPA: DNA replication/repair protein RecF [Nocardioidaceae bacterium]|nr:DNA replication/repair protein RecF [Nocardioidaceae bacterium]